MSRDCSEKLTGEHWLSADVLNEVGGGGAIRIKGLGWQGDAEHVLSVQALGARILCKRHNEALSPLDSAAGQLFGVLRHYQADLRHDPDPHGDEFALFDGPTLERWLLKVLWGAVAAGVVGDDPPVAAIRNWLPTDEWAEVLVRGTDVPTPCGFYGWSLPGAMVAPNAEVAVNAMVGSDTSLWAGSIEFGPVVFHFAFGEPFSDEKKVLHRHPQGVFIRSAAAGVRPEVPAVQKVLALGWPDVGSRGVIVTHL